MKETQYPAAGETLSQFFKNRYIKQWNRDDFEVVATAVMNKEHYVAIRRRSANLVFAVVIVLERDGDNILVRESENAEGPIYCHCPEKILSLLSPPTSEKDERWRKECFSRLRLKDLAVGSIIEFPHLLNFSGKEGKRFELKSVHPYEFKALDGTLKGRHVKIDRWMERSPAVRQEVLKLDAKRRMERMKEQAKE